jgi:hypothetical protein
VSSGDPEDDTAELSKLLRKALKGESKATNMETSITEAATFHLCCLLRLPMVGIAFCSDSAKYSFRFLFIVD